MVLTAVHAAVAPRGRGVYVVGVTVGAEMISRGMCMARARGDTESGGRGGKPWRSGVANEMRSTRSRRDRADGEAKIVNRNQEKEGRRRSNCGRRRRPWPCMSGGQLLTATSFTLVAAAVWHKHRQHAPPRTTKVMADSSMQLIGHRGASAIWPENTLQSTRAALTSGCGFEVDLQVTADGHVIVLHDPTLWRTAASQGLAAYIPFTSTRAHLKENVNDLNLEDVRSTLVGDASHTEPVPLFTEVLAELQQPPPLDPRHSSRIVHCFAELKAFGYHHSSSFDARLTEKAAEVVRDASVPPERLTWTSFSLGALLDVKRRLPSHRTLLVAYARNSAEAWEIGRLADRSNVDGIDLNADPSVLTAELVDWMHQRGRKVAVWTFEAPASNDVEAVWEALAARRVDFFTSNLPREIEAWRKAREA